MVTEIMRERSHEIIKMLIFKLQIQPFWIFFSRAGGWGGGQSLTIHATVYNFSIIEFFISLVTFQSTYKEPVHINKKITFLCPFLINLVYILAKYKFLRSRKCGLMNHSNLNLIFSKIMIFFTRKFKTSIKTRFFIIIISMLCF